MQFKVITGLNEGLAIKSTQVYNNIRNYNIIEFYTILVFTKRQKQEKAMRAFSDNEDLALLSGINPETSCLDNVDDSWNFSMCC